MILVEQLISRGLKTIPTQTTINLLTDRIHLRMKGMLPDLFFLIF